MYHLTNDFWQRSVLQKIYTCLAYFLHSIFCAKVIFQLHFCQRICEANWTKFEIKGIPSSTQFLSFDKRGRNIAEGSSNKNNLLPNSEGKVNAAGPGPWNSAAMGPRRLVGVQDPLCPPIVDFSSKLHDESESTCKTLYFFPCLISTDKREISAVEGSIS